MDSLMPRAQDAQERPAESDPFFIVARITSHSEKTVLQSATLQVLIKFFRYIGWQEPALTGQLSLELRPVFPNQLVK